MSVTGQCELCVTGTVEHTCDRCGGLVCTDHFDETTGFCVECSADVGDGGGEQPDKGDTYQL